jgi:hypothetical protein
LLRLESDFATDKPRAEVNPTHKTANLAPGAVHKSNTDWPVPDAGGG